jgi:hypothetical protein
MHGTFQRRWRGQVCHSTRITGRVGGNFANSTSACTKTTLGEVAFRPRRALARLFTDVNLAPDGLANTRTYTVDGLGETLAARAKEHSAHDDVRRTRTLEEQVLVPDLPTAG